MTSIKTKQDRDKLRQRSAERRKADRKVADTARRIVVEHLEQGRPAEACIADLVTAARGKR